MIGETATGRLCVMKLTIERVGNGFIIDAPKREELKPEINLPWIVAMTESGDDTDMMIELLYYIRDILNPNADLKIERNKDE